MIIRGWAVDAFGHLRDQQLSGLGPGVNVVVGANESGKSTLLHFLRWNLFGFPGRGRGIYKRYKPHGTAYGGRVAIDHDGSELLVSWPEGASDPVLTRPDGTELTELAWAQVVGRADQGLFENVFAVSLDELRFDNLTTDGVREHIYAAGSVGGGPSAHAALSAIDERRSALWAPRKRNLRIKQLMAELEAAIAELDAAVAEARSLPAVRSELAGLDTAKQSLAGEHHGLEAEVRFTERVIDTWESWVDANAARTEIATLPPPVDLPADPMDRLATAIERRDEAVRQLAQRSQAVEAQEARLAALAPDQSLLDLDSKITELNDAAAEARPLERDRERLSRDSDTERSALQRALDNLGPGWDIERVAHTDTSVVTRNSASRFHSDIARAAQAVEVSERHLAEARTAHDTMAQSAHDIEAELNERRTDIGEITNVADAQKAAERLGRLLEERDEASHISARPAAAPTLPPGVVRGLMSVSVAIAVIGVAAVALGQVVVGAALAVVGVAAAAFGAWLRRIVTTTSADATTVDDSVDPLARLDAEILEATQACGLRHPPTAPAVADRRKDLTALAQLEHSAARQASSLRQHHQNLEAAEDGARETATQHAEALDAWNQWCTERGLPTDLDATNTEALFSGIEQVRELNGQLRSTAQELDHVTATIEQLHQRIDDVLTAAGRQPGDDRLTQLATLRAQVVDAIETARERDQTQERLAELRVEHEAAEDNWRSAEDAVDQLLTTAGATDPAEFETIAQREARRADLTARVNETEQAMRVRFGSDDENQRAIAALESGELSRWESNRRALEERRADLAARHEESIRVHDQQLRHTHELEQSTDVPRRALRVETLRHQLQEALDEWTVLTLSHASVDRTLAMFERERQPAVITAASAAFSRITDGRYEGLVAGEAAIEVLCPNGDKLPADQLSRGTTEQLYLALRFALAQQYALTTPLPMVLDDVIVNADPERQVRLAREIGTLSNDLQVVLFTCHRATAELMVDADPDTTVVELNGQ